MEDRIRLFVKQYESLEGIVHVVADSKEAVEAVASILGGTGAKQIALGELPEGLMDAIAARCRNDKIEILKPPFRKSGLAHSIDRASAGISLADFAIAETGTIVEFTTNDALRLVSSLPETHIGIVKAEDIIDRLMDAAGPISDFYARNQDNGVVTFISGPSRSADIEMRLILGVHGPRASHAIVVLDGVNG